MHPFNRNIGAYIETDNKSHSPAANSAGTRNGTALAINTTRSIVLVANVGATAGTPTSFTVTYTLQDSLDGSSFTDCAGVNSSGAATLVVSTASSAAELDVDLTRYCRAAATHIRFTEVVAFVAGTSPTVLSGATIVRGPGNSLPQ
jgi:hypothetical protein